MRRRASGLAQPRGAAHRRAPAPTRPHHRGPPRRGHLRRGADGSEPALGTFPLATVLRNAERVWAEEIVLSVADEPRVATLLSAAPVGGDSGIETVVATLQDFAPLEELDRMRADFLGMVSHELRCLE